MNPTLFMVVDLIFRLATLLFLVRFLLQACKADFYNPISQAIVKGSDSLAAPLRKLPALMHLNLGLCEIGDEGVASLVGDLGEGDFKQLFYLNLACNKLSDTGMAMLAGAIDAGGMPKLVEGEGPPTLVDGHLLTASAPAIQAVHDALAKRHGAPPQLDLLSEFIVMANLP